MHKRTVALQILCVWIFSAEIYESRDTFESPGLYPTLVLYEGITYWLEVMLANSSSNVEHFRIAEVAIDEISNGDSHDSKYSLVRTEAQLSPTNRGL